MGFAFLLCILDVDDNNVYICRVIIHCLFSSLGLYFSLHFANVSVGTPASSYLVALDTGSDLFWLPCNCTKCVHGIELSTGQVY